MEDGGSTAWTHVSQPELPDGPLRRLALGQHLHADLAVHHGFIGERPVVIALDLRRPQEQVRMVPAGGGGGGGEEGLTLRRSEH